jgi:Fe-S oxidoreductase
MILDFRTIYTLGLIICAGGSAAYSFIRLYRLMKLAGAEQPVPDLARRLWIFFKYAVLQAKMFRDLKAGVFHMLIFVGFIVITLGSLEHMIEVFHRGFTFEGLPGFPAVALLQDVFHLLVLSAVGYFLIRRLSPKTTRLSSVPKHRRDGLIVLAFTGGHMLAGLGMFSFWIAAKNPHGQEALRPIAAAFGHLIARAGLSADTLSTIGWYFWGLHLFTVLGFSAYIPHSKHLHIFAAGPNLFLTRLRHKGTFKKIPFEDETVTSYGVGKITQFTWKDILDVYSCTACGRCNQFCPTATTGKPLRPMKLIQDMKDHLFTVGDALLADPSADPSQPLISEESGITEETVWACTTCRACAEACPVGIEHIDKIVDMRRHMVLMEGKMTAELQNTMKNWETQSNPWGMAPDTRDEWAKGLGVKSYAEHPGAEYLFYVGCAGSFNARNQKISTAFVKILQRAGVDFAILGKEELCNGETARRGGNEYLAKAMIDANIEVLKRYNVKKILSTCPHCFNTIKNEYPDFGFRAEEVIHHTEFIDRLIKEGRVKPEGKQGDTIRVAFHDSCYLGRYNEVYEAPRSALAAVPGVEVVEMPRSKQAGLCCGAGGARMWMEETIGKRVNVERAEEALAQKPDVVAAGCPYCQVMLSDGVNAKGQGETVKVLDVAEVVAGSLS